MNKQGKDGIEWCTRSWNPVTGCLHNCPYCYAAKIYKRFKRSFEPAFHPEKLGEPTKIKEPQKIFVGSTTDLFGNFIPDEWIKQVFDACEEAPQHTYMFLTKNPGRYEDICDGFPEQAHCLYGTTITCQQDIYKIPNNTKPIIDFLSIEPLLGAVDINSGMRWRKEHHSYIPGECVMQPERQTIENHMLQWVIIGQQTGPGAVKPKPEWVQSIIDQCRAAGVPVFVKSPLFEQFPIQEWPEGLK
jgi:protein gp37